MGGIEMYDIKHVYSGFIRVIVNYIIAVRYHFQPAY